MVPLHSRSHSRSLSPKPFLAIQTLGEEYTNIWVHPKWARSPRIRAAFILLPIIPPYILTRLGPPLYARYPRSKGIATTAVNALEVAGEVNLALFYISGVYYRLVRRLLGVPHVHASLTRFLRWMMLMLESGNPADFRNTDRPKHSATIVLIAWHPHPRSNRPSPPELLSSSFATARAIYCRREEPQC